jgi:hypothetical protein
VTHTFDAEAFDVQADPLTEELAKWAKKKIDGGANPLAVYQALSRISSRLSSRADVKKMRKERWAALDAKLAEEAGNGGA